MGKTRIAELCRYLRVWIKLPISSTCLRAQGRPQIWPNEIAHDARSLLGCNLLKGTSLSVEGAGSVSLRLVQSTPLLAAHELGHTKSRQHNGRTRLSTLAL